MAPGLPVPPSNSIWALITRILCPRVGGGEQIRWQDILHNLLPFICFPHQIGTTSSVCPRSPVSSPTRRQKGDPGGFAHFYVRVGRQTPQRGYLSRVVTDSERIGHHLPNRGARVINQP